MVFKHNLRTTSAEPSPTVNIEEAAALLKVHPETALKIIQAGDIPAAKVGRAWVMMTKDVLSYIQKQIIEQTSNRLSASGTASRRTDRPTKGRLPGRSL